MTNIDDKHDIYSQTVEISFGNIVAAELLIGCVYFLLR